jgi:hypothetical protein
LSHGPRRLAKLYEKANVFGKKNPIAFNCLRLNCFKLSEIFALTEPNVVFVNKK